MEKTGSIEKFNRLLLDERGAWLEHRHAPTAADLADKRSLIHAHLKEVGKTGDMDLILATEKAMLVTDLTLYSNSPAMKGSLTAALEELKAAEKLLPKVRDPGLYLSVDEAHSLPKNRIGGVPRDEARQFFRSHDSRLVNMDKSRLDDDEKTIVDERKRNIRVAEKAYIAVQRKTLCLSSSLSPDLGMSR